MVTAEARSDDQILISWDEVARANSYLILQRRLGFGGNWLSLGTVETETTTYIHDRLSSNATYEYRIQAVNPLGNSPHSISAMATTDPETPSNPFLYTLSATPGNVSVDWSSSSSADSYILQRKLSGESVWTTIAVVPSENSEYEDGTVAPTTTYDYQVQAINSLYQSDFSNVQSISTPALPLPSTPVGLSARPISGGEIVISWGDTEYEESYQLTRAEAGSGQWVVLATLSSDVTIYHDTSVNDGVAYEYRVQALNSSGNSSLSAISETIASDVTYLLFDDFDDGIDGPLWQSTSGGTAVDGGAGFLGNSALWFGGTGLRNLSASPLNISRRGTIDFLFRAGNQAVDGSTYWNNSESGEYVIVEYSNDGVNWTVLQTINTITQTSWMNYKIPIPSGLIGDDSAYIRGRQQSHSGNALDTWALDQVFGLHLSLGRPFQTQYHGHLITSVNVYHWMGRGAGRSQLHCREID